MAIDQSLPALAVNPVGNYLNARQGVSSLRDAGQLQQLRQQEGQMNQQRITLGNIGVQQAQQGYADEQAVNNSLSTNTKQGADGNSTVDRTSVLNDLFRSGHGKAAATLGTQWAGQDAASAKASLDNEKTQLGNVKAHIDTVGQMLQGILSQPTPELQAQAYQQAHQQAQQQGLVKPGELPDQYDPQMVQRLLATSMTQKDTLEQKQKELNYKLDQNKAAQTAAYQTGELKQGAQRTGIEGARLGLERQKYKDSMGGPDGSGLVDSIGTGKIAMDRLAYLVAKNPALLESVTAKYPDFDGSKAGAYVNAYKDFTSSKAGSAGGALNAGGTALGHLQELKALNTVGSHIPGTPAHNAYMNKVDTVATELAKFYGDSTVSGIGAIRSTLASNLPGTRDAAIKTQAQSMGDKFDAYQQTWDNAAPSKAYEAPMPQISQKAMEARAALDPNYHAAQVMKGQNAASTSGGMMRARDDKGQLHEAPVGTPLPAGWKAE
jgi:hypothetical protein